ncbi:RNA-binding domain superfamily, partial [Sesbania bispinosa]
MLSSTKQVAQGLGDTNLPRPWSRYSKNKENEVTTPDANKHARTKGQGGKSKDIVDINDAQLQDFLQVMEPRTRGKLWANDTWIVSNVGNNQGVSNKDSKGTSDSSEDTCGKGVTNDKAQVKQEGQSSNPEDEKGVFESSRLFVRNLPYTTTVEELQNHVEEELQKHFSKLKRVTEVHLVVDKNTKQPKGIAYIHFSDPEFAARALKMLDGSIFQGRLLHVMPAIQRPSNNKDNNVSKNKKSQTFKQHREEKRKAAEATGDTKAWNSLFMRRDTIMEYIARKYDVSKSDLLDREADDLAVRIALGETQVILETKKALTNVGVNVESLEELANVKGDGVKRSNHVLLVKNLPFTSTEKELARMFGKFGSLDKIILPPTKTLAL